MNAAVTLVSGTAKEIVPVRKRHFLFIYNNSSATIYLGNKGVTVADGYPLASNTSLEHVKNESDLGLFKDAIWGIQSSGSDAELRVWEGYEKL